MPAPYNYTQGFKDPTSGMLESMQVVKGMQQLKAQRDAQEAQAQAKAAFQTDMKKLGDRPTPSAIATLSTKYPQMSEQFKRSYDMLSQEKQQSGLKQLSGVYAAIEAGENEIAGNLLKEYATAHRNSGDEETAKHYEAASKLLDVSPEVARKTSAMLLSSIMGPGKFTETFTKLQSERREAALAPETLTEAQAKAREAATKADFAASQVAGDLQKQGWDIYKIQEDVKTARENSRIAALKANLDREKNEQKREELDLKLEEMKRKRDQSVRDRASELSAATTNIDNSLSVVDRLLANPELNNILGAVEGSAFYPSTLVGLISPFSDADKRVDAMADLETIQSQSFLNNLVAVKASGASFGALSNTEGQRLVDYVRSLQTKQSEPQFRSNMDEIQRLLLLSRTNLADKHGVPQTIPDTPGAAMSAPDVAALIEKYAK
ncbi:MAG: hypothetical protein GY774_36210 [Planctomycetes bacterium]|nr:hypothetical protein [Planctomycetota bacterium]